MSNNITLSSYSPKDREWLGELLAEQDVRRFLQHLTTDVYKFTCDMDIAERKGLGKLWIIRLAEKGVGFIAVYDLTDDPFIFYAMLPEYRNKGYMRNAIRMMGKKYSSTLSTIVYANNVQSMSILANTTINMNEIII